MKGLNTLIAAICIAVGSSTARSVHAESTSLHRVTFRLHVSGHIETSSTFCVAYGPLAGRFGVIRLQPKGAGTYAATRSLPATGHTTFYYLAGSRVVHTRSGDVPGAPVVTIRSEGPVAVSALKFTSVEWQAPIG